MPKARKEEYTSRLQELHAAHMRTIDEHLKRSKSRLQQAAKKLVADCEAKQKAVQDETTELHGNLQELKAVARSMQKVEKVEMSALAQGYEAKAKELTSDALKELQFLKDDHIRGGNGIDSGTTSDLEDESDAEAA